MRQASLLAPRQRHDLVGRGETLVDAERLRVFILELYSEQIDLHLHTSGDGMPS
jgi:predicted amidohydrolase YtcJ